MRYFFILFFIALTSVYAQAHNLSGEKIFETTCASCHAKDGSANTTIHLVVMPRNLKLSILDEEQSYQIIKKGSRYWGSAADIMPSFESVYDEKELRAVAHYIRTQFNPTAKQRVEKLYAQSDVIPKEKLPKMLKRGKKIYKRNCSWCHGLTGEGDGVATRNPEKSIYPYNLRKTLLDEKQIFLYAKYGGKYFGTHKDDMPKWSRKYDDFTLKSVAKYIVEEFKK
jgi:mono/diheme cytochrome c family protein